MILKDLIKKLQELENSYDAEYRAVMGEPDIVIDVFREIPGMPLHFQYAGFSQDIKITYSADGVYPILTAFIGD